MAAHTAARRALSPFSTTLLPFLYQTRSILGHPRRTGIRRLHLANEVPRRAFPPASSPRSPASPYRRDDDYEYDIPFESENVDADQPMAFHKQRQSTITETERQTFEKLFQVYASSKERKEAELDIMPEHLSDSAEESLDSILDSALSPGKKSDEESPSITAVIEERVERGRRSLMRSQTTAKVECTSLKRAQKEQFDRVEGLLKAANSDVKLWNVLEREVFSVIRRLDLDGTQAPEQPGEGNAEIKADAERAPEQTFSELEVIGPNYPSFLLVAMRQLRVDFPSSTFSLAILPTIKNLGRGSFALGASTELYNELIATTWLTYCDFQGVDDLLVEMENGGIDFDSNTLDLLDSIKKNAFDATVGRLGNGVSVVLDMDRFRRGLRRLLRWRDAIRTRMEVEAIRQAKQREEMAFLRV